MNDLFSWKGQPRAHARNSDPRTSLEAADSVQRIRESQQHILDALVAWGPMSDEEIIGRMMIWGIKISPSGCRSRRAELVDRGLVMDSGVRKKTASGRNCIVWKTI